MKKLIYILILFAPQAVAQIDSTEAQKMFKRINFQRSIRLKKSYQWSDNIAAVAALRVEEMMRKGQHAGHATRIKEVKRYMRCTSYSPYETNHVRLYIQDKGVPGKGHRKALLGDYTQVGIAFGKKRNKYWSCVLLY